MKKIFIVHSTFKNKHINDIEYHKWEMACKEFHDRYSELAFQPLPSEVFYSVFLGLASPYFGCGVHQGLSFPI